MYAGGWGKKAKDFSEAELANNANLESKPVENYELQQQSDFMARVMADRAALKKKKESDFLAIASSAGLLNSQTPADSEDETVPLGSFMDRMGEDEDDLDLRVYDDPEKQEVKKNSLDGFEDIGSSYDPDTSITRMDNVNDNAKWGD